MTDASNEDFDWTQMDFLSKMEDLPEGVKQVAITEDALAKRLVWDITPCQMAVQVAEFLGMHGASEEVEEMEHTECHSRLEAPAQLAEMVDEMSMMASKAVLAAQLMVHEMPVSAMDDHVEKLQPLVFQSTWAIIAELVDLGLIHLPHIMFIGKSDE